MHTKPMSEHEGKFEKPNPCERACPRCGATMTEKVWTSDCGGYEDTKYSCTNQLCCYFYWIDGADS